MRQVFYDIIFISYITTYRYKFSYINLSTEKRNTSLIFFLKLSKEAKTPPIKIEKERKKGRKEKKNPTQNKQEHNYNFTYMTLMVSLHCKGKFVLNAFVSITLLTLSKSGRASL